MPNAAHSTPFDRLRKMAATMLAILETRLGIISLDLREAAASVIATLVLAALAVVCASLVIVLLAFFVIVLFWDSYRLSAFIVLMVLLVGGAAGLLLAARRQVQTMSALFAGTRAELARDFESLGGNGAAPAYVAPEADYPQADYPGAMREPSTSPQSAPQTQ